MQRKKYLSLGEIISESIKELNISDEMLRQHAMEVWRDSICKHTSGFTASIYFSERVMIIKLTSSVFRHEMQMNKQAVLQRIRKEMQNDYVEDIIFR